MEKMKNLNEDLLKDEKEPDMIDMMRGVAFDLKELLIHYKNIAKAKGLKYNVILSKQEYYEKINK